MVFDFAAQPPELISAKIYSGPGTGSLQSAATAWEGLAGELQSTAANYQSVIAGLVSGDWTGPSSEAAAAAAAPYVSWLSTTAGAGGGTAGPGAGRAHRLRARVGSHRAAGRDHREPHSAAVAVADEHLGAEQRVDRGPRGRVRPVLGPGRRRRDRLRRLVASGHHWPGLIHRGAADDQRHRPDRSGGHHRPGGCDGADLQCGNDH